jgi:hypothetical protein
VQDFVKSDMSYLDDGRPLFRLRLRLCSTIHPTNERLQAFHAEYDKHMLGGGGLPSSALLSVSPYILWVLCRVEEDSQPSIAESLQLLWRIQTPIEERTAYGIIETHLTGDQLHSQDRSVPQDRCNMCGMSDRQGLVSNFTYFIV